MQKPPRIWVSNANPKKGEVLRVRAQMEHTMESGLRTDPATGKLRPRNIVTHFEAKLGNALLFSWAPGTSRPSLTCFPCIPRTVMRMFSPR